MLIGNKSSTLERIHNMPSFSLQEQDLTFILTSKGFKQEIINQIRQAQRRIYITALYWERDEAGQEILAEIFTAKQKNPNLDIKIFVDWHRSQRNLIGAEKGFTNANWYAEQIQKHGMESLFYGVPVNTLELFGVLHIKGFVFDDCILYSGASINNVYLHHKDKYRYDRYHKINQPQLADQLVEFMQTNLLNHSKAVHSLDQANPPKTKSIRGEIRQFRKALSQQNYALFKEVKNSSQFAGQGQLCITPIFGLGKRRNALNHLVFSLFKVVDEKLTICTPYFNLPQVLQKSIKRLLKEGKKIEIIVGDKTANDFYIPPSEPFKVAGVLPYLYESNLRKFAKKFQAELDNQQLTIRLWKNGDNSYHLKGIWVDDKYLLLTGNNLNPRAWRLDAENGLLVQDQQQQLLPKVERELNEIRQHTSQITNYEQLQTVDEYPAPAQKLIKKFKRLKADTLVRMVL